MKDLVYFYPEGHEAHHEPGHPERPERIEAIRGALEEAGWWQIFPHLQAISIPESVLIRVHSTTYLSTLQRICRRGEHYDMDTYTTPASWNLALQAAGGACAVVDAVWNDNAGKGFALTRPPGHHATRVTAMGFCLLNNIAIASEYLIQIHGVKKLAIVDLDLHHGNGTQNIFYGRDDVFYLSTHQSPHYPGTGMLDETGEGAGLGTNANFPLPPFSGDQAFSAVMDALILPLLTRYAPEIILVSYGFDAHWSDPLGNLWLSAEGYGLLIQKLTGWCEENCQGKIVLILEGGYSLEAARSCSLAVTAALLGENLAGRTGAGWGPAPRSEGTAWMHIVEEARRLWKI